MSSVDIKLMAETHTASDCRLCDRRDRCFIATQCDAAAEISPQRFTLSSGQRLYRLGGRCDSLFQVCSGSIKTQRETADGDVVVTGFYLAGDLVGVDALEDRIYPSDAIACRGTVEVCQLDFARLLACCANQTGLNAWIISAIGGHVRRRDNDLSWSGSQHSRQRVLRFFLELNDRLGDAGKAHVPVVVPMRKQDIARYLHLTPETLSRGLAQLKRDGLLFVSKDRFMLPDTNRARRATGT